MEMQKKRKEKTETKKNKKKRRLESSEGFPRGFGPDGGAEGVEERKAHQKPRRQRDS